MPLSSSDFFLDLFQLFFYPEDLKMKLSDVRPCDNCGGPIAPIFYAISITHALFDQSKTNMVLGLNNMFGGAALPLAEAMSGAEPVVKLSEKDKEMETEIFLCSNCCIGQAVDLGKLMQAAWDRKNAGKRDEDKQSTTG